jgi:hypothetical protein
MHDFTTFSVAGKLTVYIRIQRHPLPPLKLPRSPGLGSEYAAATNTKPQLEGIRYLSVPGMAKNEDVETSVEKL